MEVQNGTVGQVNSPVTATGNTGTTNNATGNGGTPNVAGGSPSTGNVPNEGQTELDKQFAERAERAKRSTIDAICKKYGVADEAGLDTLAKKAQSFDAIKGEHEDYVKTKQSLAFVNNSIDPAMEDDIEAYFKGKGLELNDKNIKEELAKPTHSNWVKKVVQVNPVANQNATPNKVIPTGTTIETLSPDQHSASHDDEIKFRKMFGLK